MPNATKDLVGFSINVAEELVSLLRDKPGTANEDLLDEALANLQGTYPTQADVPTKVEKAAGEGRAVLMEASVEEIDAAIHLISHDKVSDLNNVRSLANTIQTKLRIARKRRRD